MIVADLRDCPFCGGDAKRFDIDEGENAGGSCIACTRCLASGNVEFGRKENFVSNWNRRADTQAADEIARLRKRLEVVEDWSEDADGIACRNDTIRLQDERIARLREERRRLVEALKVADDAIKEMFRYYDGGETRGSYDGKPERAQLRKAGYATRAMIAAADDGGR